MLGVSEQYTSVMNRHLDCVMLRYSFASSNEETVRSRSYLPFDFGKFNQAQRPPSHSIAFPTSATLESKCLLPG